MKKCAVFTLALVLLRVLVGCSGSIDEITYDMPNNGVWYCEKLEVSIVLDRMNGVLQPSYAVINGENVKCICEGEYNTPYLFLCCQESGVSDFQVGEVIYWWSLIEYNDDVLILEDHETKELYTFDRIV